MCAAASARSSLTLPPVDASYTTKVEGGVGQFKLQACQAQAASWKSMRALHIEIVIPSQSAVRLNAKPASAASTCQRISSR